MTKTITLHRVTMNMTSRDLQRIENLKRRLSSRSSSQAVSSAVGISASLIDMLDVPGNQLVYKPPGNNQPLQRVIIAGLS